MVMLAGSFPLYGDFGWFVSFIFWLVRLLYMVILVGSFPLYFDFGWFVSFIW